MGGVITVIVCIAVVMALIWLCDTVHKAIQRKADQRRIDAERSKGAFKETAPESLADRFKNK